MPNKQFSFVGLMSGSSLDGLDLALCSFEKTKSGFKGSLLKTASSKFPKILATRLASAASLDNATLAKLDHDFGTWCGLQVRKHFPKDTFTAIASHGHTILHNPLQGYSLQIGHGASIAAAAQKPVICDFRNNDIAHGGQGAPLVPFGEKHLFEKVDAFLNLGGIANISFLHTEKPIAYDICGCNQWLNAIANAENKAYDKDGKMAKKGIVDLRVLKKLQSWTYYKKQAPKSLSNQAVMEHFTKNIPQNIDAKDLSATFVEHIADKISESLLHFAPRGSVLITGGGAFHPLLIEKIKQKSNWQLIIPDSIKVQFKEAYIFAFLGYCRWLGLPNTVSQLTGAQKDTCSGAIYLP